MTFHVVGHCTVSNNSGVTNMSSGGVDDLDVFSEVSKMSSSEVTFHVVGHSSVSGFSSVTNVGSSGVDDLNGSSGVTDLSSGGVDDVAQLLKRNGLHSVFFGLI